MGDDSRYALLNLFSPGLHHSGPDLVVMETSNRFIKYPIPDEVRGELAIDIP